MSTDVQSLMAVTRAAARAGADQLATRPAAGRMDSAEAGAETKSSDSDWVTDFDRASEEAIRNVLQAYRPNDEIYGEEFGSTEVEEPSGYRWSIDPLDGTTNFLRGLPHFAASVAVEHEGLWQAAAIIAPALGLGWYAGRGQGAYRITVHGDTGLPTQVEEPVKLTGPTATQGRLLGTGFSYLKDRRAFQFEQLRTQLDAGEFADIRRLGSAALDLCMVAEGSLDAFAEYGLQEFDWAAGALIAAEAGVKVRRPAWAESETTPDWTVAGDLGISAWDLELHPEHPSPRARQHGVMDIERAARFGKQLLSHLGRKRGSAWDKDNAEGWVILQNTFVRARAEESQLFFDTVGPADEAERMQGVLDGHLARFTKIDGLASEWTVAVND